MSNNFLTLTSLDYSGYDENRHLIIADPLVFS